jgi:hypothetical protein
MFDLGCINPTLCDIEACLSRVFGHAFEFTESEMWHMCYLLTDRKVGMWSVDGAIITWKRVRGNVLVGITA